MNEAPRIVWGIGTSRTVRPHWMLAEQGLAYETREILPRTDSMNDPEFLARSRRGKVPILEDGPVVIGESGAIVLYLADRYRDRAVLAPMPATPERARFDELCFYILTELDAVLYVIRRHEGLADVYGEAPTATRSAREYYLRGAGEMESVLKSGGPYLLGADFSGADVLLVSCIEMARFFEVEASSALKAYRDRIAARPAFAQAMARNFPPAAREWLEASRTAERARAEGVR